MTEKHVSEMSEIEKAATLARLKRGSPPDLPPLDTSVKAKDMSESERREWFAAHRKRFPS